MPHHTQSLQRLPPELWCSIFLATLPQPPPYPIPFESLPETTKITDAPLIPMVISSVCQLWRKISCDNPQLWENCWLSYKNPEFNDLWISRAGSQGLHLIGVCPERTYHEWTKEFHPAARIEATRKFSQSILRHLPRWKSVRIDIGPLAAPILPSQEWSDMLESPGLACYAPLLEVFRQESHHDSHRLMPPWTVPLLSKAPFLKELSLFFLTGFNPNHLQIPRLVVLDIYLTSLEEALCLLQQLPQLQRLTVTANYRSGLPVPTPPVLHQNLQYLDVREEDSETTILHFITVPSLRVFCATYERQFSFFALLGLFERSGCRLQELIFTDIVIAPDPLLLLLEHKAVHSSLKGLEINYTAIHPEFLRILQYTPEHPRLPSLEHLVITGFAEYFAGLKGYDGYLADLIASRCCLPKNNKDEIVGERACLRHVIMRTLPFSNHQLDIARIVPLPPINHARPSEPVCTVDFILDHGPDISGEDKVICVLPITGPVFEESDLL